MNLGELIDKLKTLPSDMVFENGFHNPHSYRGYYNELAFEPLENTTVAEMLKSAGSAIGNTYYGWKGGEYLMYLDTPVHVAERGCSNESEDSMALLFTTIPDSKLRDAAPALIDALANLLNRIELEGCTPLDWDEFEAGRTAIKKATGEQE